MQCSQLNTNLGSQSRAQNGKHQIWRAVKFVIRSKIGDVRMPGSGLGEDAAPAVVHFHDAACGLPDIVAAGRRVLN